MFRKRQFSLGYLFVETTLVAVAMAFSRLAVLAAQGESYSPLLVAMIVGAVVWGAAIGGLFGRILEGAIMIGIILLAMFLPAIN